MNSRIINVTLISPFSIGPARGNMTTVRRIAAHLPQTGCRVIELTLDSMLFEEQCRLLSQTTPDLLHAFHAHLAGPDARLLAGQLGIPYLVTITGSDLFDPELCGEASTGQALAGAAAVTCFDQLVAGHLAQLFPEVAGRIAVVPQGVAPFPPGPPYLHGDDEFIVLLPAAIRLVKGITSAIEALTPLAGEFPRLRLLVVGGELDRLHAADIRARVATLPWVGMPGEIPHRQMGALFAAADLVLNSSYFEGGMANALLEAMIMGRPVLARDVLGNRSLIRHGQTGWLYRSDDELRQLVRSMLLNPSAGREVAEGGRLFVTEHYSIAAEVAGYRSVYERIIHKNGT